MNFLLLFLTFITSQISYKLRRVYNTLDNYEYIGQRKVNELIYKFWFGLDKELLDTPSLPEMTQKLMNCPVMKLKKKDNIYEIDPFNYVKLISQDGERVLGYFNELKFVNKNLICYYTNGDYCVLDPNQKSFAKIIFTKNNGEAEIEKYFSGNPSEHVLKVSGDFLCEKRQRTIIYYAVLDKDGIIEPKHQESEENAKDIKNENGKWINFGPAILEQLNNFVDGKELNMKGDTIDERSGRDVL